MDRIRVMEEVAVAGGSRRRDRGSEAGSDDRAELDRDAGQWPRRCDGAARQSGCCDRRRDLYRRGQPVAVRIDRSAAAYAALA